MGRKVNQLLLLTWKNYVLQKRHWVRTLFEIGLPILVSFLLIWLRTKVDYFDYKDPAIYANYSIDQLPKNLTREQCFIFPCKWRMAYTPNGVGEGRVMDFTVKNLKTGFVYLDTGRGFATEAKMLEFLTRTNTSDNKEYLGGITFHNPFPSATALPANITYSIRLKASQRNYPDSQLSNLTGASSRWHTDDLFELISTPGPRQKEKTWGGNPGYMREGFLPLQHAIDKALIQSQNISTDGFSVLMRRYPYPPYFDDFFVLVIQMQLPFLILISFVVTAITITKDVVLEKERKLKESMKIMGLNNWLDWTAWYLKYTLFLFISVAFITLLYKVPVGSHGAVINNTNPSVLLLFFFMYSLTIIAQCFAVSVLFSTANTGAVCMGLVWFFSYIPYFFINPRYESMSRGLKMISCLLANTGMSMGAYLIGLFEGTGEGIQWSNINRPVSVDDNFSFMDVIWMFLVDIVWYLVFMWYVEAVFPGSFGVPRKWYFPFQVTYWCGSSLHDDEDEVLDDDDESSHQPLTSRGRRQSLSFFEPDPKGLHAGVKIKGLKKVFTKDKAAVNGLTLNMYEGQITAILGHNGAGKTTTLSMLTGLFPPTAGTALVNNYNIRTEIDGVRQSLGLCPQHDVLFDRLTVKEHLYFFAKLKGCPSSEVDKEVENYIVSLELQDKRDAQARALSGGMRRKLCVGIALIYDSKVVMLDEPTSGMDPSARRFTWDLLQRHRSGRTILLTTHHMDEADLLGDRIAIMAKGELKCVGSSLFLKKKYGVGYHMTIAKAPHCDVARVTGLITQHVPGMLVESNVGMELSCILPQESVAHFEQLFTDLEARRDELGITSYGASVTTMEEVFLKVDQDEALEDSQEESSIQNSDSNPDSPTLGNGIKKFSVTLPDAEQGSSDTECLVVLPKRNTGFTLYLQQFRAMIQKRMYHTWRNLLIMSVQFLIPLFMTAIALIAEKTFPPIGESPALTVNIRAYGRTQVPYFLADNTSVLLQPVASNYVDYLNHLKQDPIYVNNVTDANNTNLIEYLIDVGGRELVTFNRDYLVGAALMEDQEKQKIQAMALFNNQPYHTAPASLNAIDNAMLMHYLKGKHVVTTVNHPLPRTVHEKANDDLESQFFTGFSIAFNMLFGMSFLASSFVLFLVKESASKAKHIQFVSGVHSLNFWLSTYVWDLINYTVPCVLIVVAFVAFGIEAYADDSHFLAIFLLLFLHGWAIIPLMYLFSFLFTVPSTGFVRLTMLNIIIGITAFMAVNILELPMLNLQSVADALSWVFSFSPSYCLGKGLSDFYANYGVLKICNSNPFIKEYCENPNVTAMNPFFKFNDNYLGFKAPGIGTELIFMAGTGILYFSLVILLEEGVLRSLRYCICDLFRSKPGLQVSAQPENILDDDVSAEQSRILESQLLTDALILRNLRKVYSIPGKPPLVAVEGTSLGITAGECFGLLGVNGAGKTTTFKMLTGDEAVTSGDAFVDGFNIKHNIKQVQQRIGYCPQFDALIDQMTGRETLRLYARLRGMKEAIIEAKVEELIVMFNLSEHADKMTKAYSGGNKRKLSTTIALIGDPPIVFLDEPSTGMDPATRRLLWQALCQVRNEGRCIVLTSHSMDECEALCTRLAIMVNGQIKCLGSTQHLKGRFGEGFTVLAKVSSMDGVPDMNPLKQFMQTQFPGSKLKDEHQGMVHYHITNTQLTWAQVFGTMERAKSTYSIEDYSVSQTTLEQVFLNFARMQREDLLQS